MQASPHAVSKSGQILNAFPLYLALAYAAMLIYGTLFPLTGWRAPELSPLELMLQKGLVNTSRSDILTNLLVYMPFGLLLMRALIAPRNPAGMILIVTICSALLSLVLEFSQAYLPGRVPSVGDWILNTCGGCIGALLSLSLRPDTALGGSLNRIRALYFHPGALTNLGLLVLGLWALSQLSPVVPSLDLGNIRHGLKPLWNTLHQLSSIEWLRVAEYSAGITAIGLISSTLSRIEHQFLLRFAGFSALVLLLKIPVVGRQLSLEALLGLMAGLAITALFYRSDERLKLGLAAIALLGTVTAAGNKTTHPAKCGALT